MADRLARFESSARVLAAAKLANVGLTLLWGFAVTFVFVRLLPLSEFKAFLLLVAFGNFTISAEFGVSNIAYNRLRQSWLGSGDGAFRASELSVLFLALSGLALVGTALAGLAVAAGWIATERPALFLLFLLTMCLNVIVQLMKRSLAAIDANLLWEGLDMVRRAASLGLLLAALVGLDLLVSVSLQLLLTVMAVAVAMALIARRLDMRVGDWFRAGEGSDHVRQRYWRPAAQSMALTVSEIAAYNAPYFTIAAATQDVRPMLLFDFVFKISRALSVLIRAVTEAALPRLTAAYYEKRAERFAQLIRRLLIVAVVSAVGLSIFLGFAGEWLFHALFHDKGAISMGDLALLGLLLVALAVICVSVYVHTALGRFAVLLWQSLPFLVGSLLSVPLAMMVGGVLGSVFLVFYAITFIVTAVLHGRAIERLVREQG